MLVAPLLSRHVPPRVGAVRYDNRMIIGGSGGDMDVDMIALVKLKNEASGGGGAVYMLLCWSRRLTQQKCCCGPQVACKSHR